MSVNPRLLEILACPACKAGVKYDEEKQKIICNGCGRRYPVRDDIPVMLIDEAEMPQQTEGAQQ